MERGAREKKKKMESAQVSIYSFMFLFPVTQGPLLAFPRYAKKFKASKQWGKPALYFSLNRPVKGKAVINIYNV